MYSKLCFYVIKFVIRYWDIVIHIKFKSIKKSDCNSNIRNIILYLKYEQMLETVETRQLIFI